jgi:hypothetical protein
MTLVTLQGRDNAVAEMAGEFGAESVRAHWPSRAAKTRDEVGDA